MVLSFGFCNSLTSFSHYINDTLYKYLNIFCTTYLDNILINNNSLHKHKRHLKIILDCLKSARLYLNVTKYEIHITKVLYLGFIISTHNIKMN